MIPRALLGDTIDQLHCMPSQSHLYSRSVLELLIRVSTGVL